MKIEEFTERLKEIGTAFPIEQEKVLVKGANKMRKEIRDKTPDSHVEHKRKLKKSWKVRINGTSRVSIQAEIHSTSPYFHLVERGHDIVRKGKVIGHVQGKKFMKKTVDAHKDRISEEMVEALYRMLKGRLDG